MNNTLNGTGSRKNSVECKVRRIKRLKSQLVDEKTKIEELSEEVKTL